MVVEMSRLPHMSIHECRVVKANLDAERANAAQRKRIVRNIVKLALGTIAAIVVVGVLNAYLPAFANLGASLGRDGHLPRWFARGAEAGQVPDTVRYAFYAGAGVLRVSGTLRALLAGVMANPQFRQMASQMMNSSFMEQMMKDPRTEHMVRSMMGDPDMAGKMKDFMGGSK